MLSRYASMTVNERFAHSGRLADWDAAIRNANRARMIALLDDVDLCDQAESIADRVLSESRRFS